MICLFSSFFRLCEVIAEYHAALDTLYYLSKRFGGSASTTPPDVFIKV